MLATFREGEQQSAGPQCGGTRVTDCCYSEILVANDARCERTTKTVCRESLRDLSATSAWRWTADGAHGTAILSLEISDGLGRPICAGSYDVTADRL